MFLERSFLSVKYRLVELRNERFKRNYDLPHQLIVKIGMSNGDAKQTWYLLTFCHCSPTEWSPLTYTNLYYFSTTVTRTNLYIKMLIIGGKLHYTIKRPKLILWTKVDLFIMWKRRKICLCCLNGRTNLDIGNNLIKLHIFLREMIIRVLWGIKFCFRSFWRIRLSRVLCDIWGKVYASRQSLVFT